MLLRQECDEVLQGALSYLIRFIEIFNLGGLLEGLAETCPYSGRQLISEHYLNLERLIFQMGLSPEFLNCTSIKFRVAAVPHFIPFSPVSEENRAKCQRFLGE